VSGILAVLAELDCKTFQQILQPSKKHGWSEQVPQRDTTGNRKNAGSNAFAYTKLEMASLKQQLLYAAMLHCSCAVTLMMQKTASYCQIFFRDHTPRARRYAAH